MQPQIRTQIRDATLATVSETVDDPVMLDAVEWASEETIDALALGLRGGEVGEWYRGTPFRGSAL